MERSARGQEPSKHMRASEVATGNCAWLKNRRELVKILTGAGMSGVASQHCTTRPHRLPHLRQARVAARGSSHLCSAATFVASDDKNAIKQVQATSQLVTSRVAKPRATKLSVSHILLQQTRTCCITRRAQLLSSSVLETCSAIAGQEPAFACPSCGAYRTPPQGPIPPDPHRPSR